MYKIHIPPVAEKIINLKFSVGFTRPLLYKNNKLAVIPNVKPNA